MKVLKVFAVCLTIILTQLSFSNSYATSDNSASEQKTAHINYTQYEERDGHIYLITYTEDGKIVDTVLVE